MKYFIQKIYITINLLVITSIGYAFGDCETDLSTSCETCYPCTSCECPHGFISAELLYWRAFENGLDVCVPSEVSDTILPNGNIVSRLKGRGRDPHFNWDPGVRLGAGYEFPCSHWGVAAFWTHFNSRAHGSGHQHLRWNIDFDVLDVAAGYEFDFGYCFTIRPFIGLRGAKIDQKIRTKNQGNSYSYYLNEPIFSKRRNKEEFLGLGPLIGVDGEWGVGCGLSIYANAAISWMYGRFHVNFKDISETIDATNISHIKNRLDASLASADAGIGVRWRTDFYNYHWILQVGLEHHRYFDYNRFNQYGDLSFDGVNFSAAVVF